jgi:4-amino-4-deoxy-L-arabinose transferase-like glycosyltransferase
MIGAERARLFLERRFWSLAAALILTQGVIQVVTALGETQTWDEGIHMVAGYTYWVKGDYRANPEHPALGKMLNTIPLLFLRPELKDLDATQTGSAMWAGLYFLYRNRYSPETLLFAARSVTILLTLAFGVDLAWWTRRRFGAIAALAALTLFAFDPNITAHGRYVTSDLVASLFVFLTATLWVEYLLAPSPRWLILSGLSLGCALGSKYSTLFLVPVMLVLYAARAAWLAYKGDRLSLSVTRFFLATAALGLLSISVLALIYAPEVARSRELPRLRPMLLKKGPVGPALEFAARKLSLKAYSYLYGLDRLSEHDNGGHQSYLMGQFGMQGWWYYFPVAFLVKTPVGTILILALAIPIGLIGWKRLRPFGFPLLGLVIPSAVFLFFCIRSHIDIGHRHLLPFYPFAYVVAAAVFVHAGPPALRRANAPLFAALLTLAVTESLAIYPHYLAFFNFASGGPENGPKYLLDSNIDWGQDLMKLGRWESANHLPTICIAFFGNGDLQRYLTKARGLPETYEEQRDVDCVVAVSATPLYGLYMPHDEYRYWREQKPFTRIGYSIYIYDHRKKRS